MKKFAELNIIDSDTMLHFGNKATRVKSNNEIIENMMETNQQYLKEIVDSTLLTGHQIIGKFSDGDIAMLNNLIFVPWKTEEFDSAYNNVNHIKRNLDRNYFITQKSITEVYFKDSLETSEFYYLVDDNQDEFNIELIFKSPRVRNNKRAIYGNKYRFKFSKLTNKVTVRKLTE